MEELTDRELLEEVHRLICDLTYRVDMIEANFNTAKAQIAPILQGGLPGLLKGMMGAGGK